MNDGDEILTVRNLNVSYGKIAALNDVSIGLRKGQIVTILGPNGAGRDIPSRSGDGRGRVERRDSSRGFRRPGAR